MNRLDLRDLEGLEGIQKNPASFEAGFLYMAHSGGFEPPTARFVAEYSIQLSYECVFNECEY